VLIRIRYAHQSEEEANSVHIARARTGSSHYQGNEGDSEQEENHHHHPHRPPENDPHNSQRRHLAKEINEIIKASTGTAVCTGESTGLNRLAWWKTEKLAAGSTIPADSNGVVTVTGNSANARLAAQKTTLGVSA